jgi:putative ABC transport system permease protein
MDTLIGDVRFALRSLVRSPSFAITAVLALGLGIGSTAGVFSLLEGVVLRPLPYRAPSRLVTIWDSNREKGLKHEPISPVTFHDYRALSSVFADAAAWWRPQLNLADETGDPIRVSAVETTENLFDVLGVQPAMGRGFTVHPGLFGPEHEAIISHRLWQTRFGGNPGIIGRAIRLNGFTYTVVGIMPAGFGFPGETDLWQQLQWDLHYHSRARISWNRCQAAPGVTTDRANRELAALGVRLGNEFRGTNAGWTPKVIELDRETAGVFRPGLFALFGASALLLTLACINVANLLLARASGRRREVALRSAIGASRGRLVRLFLTESVVLAAAGAGRTSSAVLSVKALMAASPVRFLAPTLSGSMRRLTRDRAATAPHRVGSPRAGVHPVAPASGCAHDGSKGSGAQGRALRSALVVVEVAPRGHPAAVAGFLVAA